MARILTFAEYAAIRHPTPYVVDVRRGPSRLVLFGARHSADPTDPMFDQMQTHARVFATVGVSHAVMLEPALRAAADAP